MTMLELSRWTEEGGSYRTIQRLYHTPILTERSLGYRSLSFL